jgi:glycosyltransferase involved in cell wall biosynthesis
MTDRDDLLIPERDVDDPQVSIVIPTLNEEATVGEFIAWCLEGIERAGVRGEIIIVDSSTDRTAEIAHLAGARVLMTPREGLGRAYQRAVPYIRGRFVLMGDADCTYDFRDIEPFLRQLRAGADFVMGSRFRGSIERGAMPLHHRYFGTPLTTWMLNVFARTRLSDIHCGMRAMTIDALRRIDLQSDGWEYASEMILRAVHLRLQIVEVPIDFYRDRANRISNIKRQGWSAPWIIGWHTLRMIFTNGADLLLFGPGLIAAALGTVGVLVLSVGPVTIGPVTMTSNTEVLFSAIASIGILFLFLAFISKAVYDPSGLIARQYASALSFTRVAIASACLLLVAIVIGIVFCWEYVDHDFRITKSMETLSHLMLAGIFCAITAFTLFAAALVVQAVAQGKQETLRAEARLRDHELSNPSRSTEPAS